jgi:hypothetical protein
MNETLCDFSQKKINRSFEVPNQNVTQIMWPSNKSQNAELTSRKTGVLLL